MIHAEVYLLWNAALSGISLLLGGKLAGLSAPKKSLLLLASMLSGSAALLALHVPSLNAAALFLCPLFVWLCYREHGLPACIRALVTTFCAAALVGGAGTLLLRLGQAPAAALCLAGLLALLLWTLCVLLPTAFCDVKQVEITHEGRSVLLPAMLDSGNLVRDPLSLTPVIVVPEAGIRPLFPELRSLCALEELPVGFRLLRVRTAAGSGLWPLFRPDRCRVYVNGQVTQARAMVAVAGSAYGGIQALVPLAAVAGHAVQGPSAASQAV